MNRSFIADLEAKLKKSPNTILLQIAEEYEMAPTKNKLELVAVEILFTGTTESILIRCRSLEFSDEIIILYNTDGTIKLYVDKYTATVKSVRVLTK